MKLRHHILLTATAIAGCAIATTCIGQGVAAESPANEVRAYSLDECIAIGLEKATQIVNAKRGREIAEARIDQSWAEVLPSLSAQASYVRLDTVPTFDMGGQTIQMGKMDTETASVTVNQLIYSGGRAGAAIKAARLYRKYATQEEERAWQALVRDIKTAFNDILLARTAVNVSEQSVRQLQAFVGEMENKFKSGAASEFDWLSARVRLANETPGLISARNNLAVAKEGFRNLVHLDEGDYDLRGELTCEPVELDLKSFQSEAMKRRPELRQMLTQIELLEQDRAATAGSYYPNLRAFGSYTGTDPDQTSFGSLQWGWHWTAGITASWSIFDGGLTRGLMRQKSIELARARSLLDDLKRGILLETKQAWLDTRHSKERVAGGAENVALAERALGIAQTRVQEGLATSLEFTETNLALSIAKLGYWSALHDYQNALARLQYACGTGKDKQ